MQTQLVTFTSPLPLLKTFDTRIKKYSKNRSDFYREAMEKFIKEEELFDKVFAYGQKQAKKMGITEDDVDRIVHEVREGR
jgi:metal-responsive CopG/Arc/MetJ family transcriptional regulator